MVVCQLNAWCAMLVSSKSLLNALVPAVQWVWTTGSQLFTGSLHHSMQRLHYQEYLVTRYNNRQLRAAAPRWIHNSVALMVTLIHAEGRRSSRARGRLVSHLYDWMAHKSNLTKGTNENDRASAATCPLCGTAATQAHINTSCCHPAMQDLRILLKRDIDMHFLSLRHTVLPAAQRWTHVLCGDTPVGGLGEGRGHRWSRQLLADILIEHADTQIPPKEYISAMQWLANLTLTLTLQKTQTVLYSTPRDGKSYGNWRYSRNRPILHLDDRVRDHEALETKNCSRPGASHTPEAPDTPKRPPRYHNRCD
jgi:hypothetical protein